MARVRLWLSVLGACLAVVFLPSSAWSVTSPDTSTATATPTGSEPSPSDPGSDPPATSSPTSTSSEPSPAGDSATVTVFPEWPESETVTETVVVQDVVLVTAEPGTGEDSPAQLRSETLLQALVIGTGLGLVLLGAHVVGNWGK